MITYIVNSKLGIATGKPVLPHPDINACNAFLDGTPESSSSLILVF